MTNPAPARPEWVDRKHAAAILGVDARAITRLSAQGRIGTRDLPVKARFRLADVEKLAKESATPAEHKALAPGDPPMLPRRAQCCRCQEVMVDVEPVELTCTSRKQPLGLPDPAILCPACASAVVDLIRGHPARLALAPR